MIKRKIKRATYTPEFKKEVVRQVLSGQTCSNTARIFGIPIQTLDNWLKQFKGNLHKENLILDNFIDEKTQLSSTERMELSRLRSENERLKNECDLLKKATAYFAREVK